MKITIVEEKVNSLNYLIVAYDVSKGKLNYFSKFNNSKGEVCELEDIVSNRVKHLERHFIELRTLEEENGFHGVCIACEPTGGYEKKFLHSVFILPENSWQSYHPPHITTLCCSI